MTITFEKYTDYIEHRLHITKESPIEATIQVIAYLISLGIDSVLCHGKVVSLKDRDNF
tara:strand:- start:296 stop:469 length:174 start_codon:yes stop_codon:yes gene_type:complete